MYSIINSTTLRYWQTSSSRYFFFRDSIVHTIFSSGIEKRARRIGIGATQVASGERHSHWGLPSSALDYPWRIITMKNKINNKCSWLKYCTLSRFDLNGHTVSSMDRPRWHVQAKKLWDYLVQHNKTTIQKKCGSVGFIRMDTLKGFIHRQKLEPPCTG